MENLRKVLPRPRGRHMVVQPHKDAFASMPKGLLSYSTNGAVFSRQKADVRLFFFFSGTSSYLRINLYKTLPDLFRMAGRFSVRKLEVMAQRRPIVTPRLN